MPWALNMAADLPFKGMVSRDLEVFLYHSIDLKFYTYTVECVRLLLKFEILFSCRIFRFSRNGVYSEFTM
jgi:hypothetical protein